VHPDVRGRMGDGLEPVRRDLVRQRQGQHGRDVIVDVVAGSPDVGEAPAASEPDLALGHDDGRRSDRGHDLLHSPTDREAVGDPRKRSSGPRSAPVPIRGASFLRIRHPTPSRAPHPHEGRPGHGSPPVPWPPRTNRDTSNGGCRLSARGETLSGPVSTSSRGTASREPWPTLPFPVVRVHEVGWAARELGHERAVRTSKGAVQCPGNGAHRSRDQRVRGPRPSVRAFARAPAARLAPKTVGRPAVAGRGAAWQR
jgi:hypothetical protein